MLEPVSFRIVHRGDERKNASPCGSAGAFGGAKTAGKCQIDAWIDVVEERVDARRRVTCDACVDDRPVCVEGCDAGRMLSTPVKASRI